MSAVPISIDWKLITDPTFLSSAKECLVEDTRSMFSKGVSTDDLEGYAQDRQAFGSDFSKIYYYPIEEVVAEAQQQVEDLIRRLTGTVKKIQKPKELSGPLRDSEDADFSSDFLDKLRFEIEETITKKFGPLIYEEFSRLSGTSELKRVAVTTENALRLSGFTFNHDKTIATPPAFIN